jgi:DNA-3-methyladenine glycosylase II
LLRWFLSLHSPDHSFSISPEKVGGPRETKAEEDELPSASNGEVAALEKGSSSTIPGSSRKTEDLPEIPPTFTPSIKKVLRKSGVDTGKVPAPLPAGLDVATMKSRLKGKKTK